MEESVLSMWVVFVVLLLVVVVAAVSNEWGLAGVVLHLRRARAGRKRKRGFSSPRPAPVCVLCRAQISERRHFNPNDNSV